jgi:hypothetical protein
MSLKTLKFLTMIFTGLTLGAGLAHLYSFPNKIDLPQDDYFTVQQAYRGWQFIGISMFGQIVFGLWLVLKSRQHHKIFRYAVAALICILMSVAIFFIFTFPTNIQTHNWTYVPPNWQVLRDQWEYSHAAAALFSLAAFVFLTFCLMSRREQNERQRYSWPTAGWKED